MCAVTVFHPRVKKILRHAERRIMNLTQNQDLCLVILNPPAKILPYPDVERIVCEVTGIPFSKAITQTRRREVCLTRQLIAFFARMDCGYHLQQIADKLNREDHTTIISSLRRIRHLIDSGDSEVCGYVKEINQRLSKLKVAV